jgi:hypothetical protein
MVNDISSCSSPLLQYVSVPAYAQWSLSLVCGECLVSQWVLELPF